MSDSLHASDLSFQSLISQMGHDIRGSLNTILGFNQMLLDDQEPALNDSHRLYANFVRQEGQRLLQLMNDVSDYFNFMSHFKHEVAGNSIEYSIFPLQHVLNHCIALHQPIFQEKSIHLELPDLEPLDILLKGDPKAISKILDLSLGLMQKIGNQSTLNVQIRKVEKVTHKRKYLQLIFQLAPVECVLPENPFTPFSKLKTKDALYECGLGLCMVQKLIEPMQGSFRMQPEANKFILDIQLPMEDPRAQNLKAE